MKVALIYFGRKGGGPVYSFEIANRLNTQVDLFCLISSEVENLKVWEESKIKIFPFYTYKNAREFVFSLLNIKRFLEIKRLIKKIDPDVVYYPFFHLWLPIINLFIGKVPKVYTCHDPILHTGENGFLSRWWQDILIRSSRRVIILSKVFIDVIKKRGIKEKNIDVIPHGILDYYKLNREISVTKQHSRTLLFFGRIISYKGLDNLLQIFFSIKKECPDCRLLIVGQGDISQFGNLTKQPGVEIVNRWIPDEDVYKYFYQSDVLVCPYKDASQSGAIPIAYSFSIPVVATDVGGLVEQVENGVTGILVPRDDKEELKKACVKLLTGEELRNRMGENGFNKATKEWNWEKITQKVLACLNKAINI
jgi:glycosyltransferase involved in cell wall biosynthesis